MNYYDNLKLGGGEVKLYYYAMKGSMGGALPKKFFKKVERHQRRKKVDKKLEGGCLWFLRLLLWSRLSFKTHFIIHPPPFLQIKVHFLNLSLMENWATEVDQEVDINTYNNLFHFIGHNNDLLFLKQWKGAVISLLKTRLLLEILQKIVFWS